MENVLKCICVMALSTGLAGASTINVADYGIVPGKDVSLEVNQLIASLKGKNEITLFFPKGQYEFYPENAVESYRAVTNHDNSLKHMAFPIFEMDGLTIDGGGSSFVFHGRISPFVLEGSEDITLKNFTIDWDTPFHHELKIVERDEKTNSLENIGYGDETRYPLYAAPLLRPEQRLGEDQYHRNIRFTNNRIKSFNGHFVHALSVKGLTITGNTIELSRDYPMGSKRASIELEYCDDVTIADNQFTGFDWPIRIERSGGTKF